MTEKEFYKLLQAERLAYISWNKEACALFQEVKDGVKLYRGNDGGLIRFAESIWIIAIYKDPDTGITYAMYEKYREFVNGVQEERKRFFFDPITGFNLPIAISETLKKRKSRRGRVELGFDAAVRALGKKEEGGLSKPDRRRLKILSVMSPHYKPSVAFKGITSVTIGEIVLYQLTKEEWNEWGDEFPSIDENNVKTVLGKVRLPLN